MAAQELSTLSLFNDANLVAYYRMNTGALTTDSKGSFTLTNTNSVGETASGKFGYAADYGTPNTTKYLTIASSYGVNTYNGVFSVSFWAKLGAEVSSGSYGFWGMETQTDATHKVLNYLDYEYNGGTRRLHASRYSDGGASMGQNSGYHTVALGTDWNHFVYTYDQSNIRLYLNGAIAITQATTNHFGTTYSPVAYYGFSGGAFYPGLGDDIAVFTRVLTAAEILDIYDHRVGGALFFAQY